MKHIVTFCLVFGLLAFFVPSPTLGHQDDDEETGARGWFINSRPKEPARPKPRPPRAKAQPKPQPRQPKSKPPVSRPPNTERIGIGYSLFKEGPGGQAIRVDPARTFRVGDNVRLVIEPSVDGYVYVFYTENGRNPTMIYPDARLDEGANDVQGHTVVEIPSSLDPRFQWFKIVGDPAVERLYVLVTREPIPSVPIGPDLVTYCKTFARNCPWKPSEGLWDAIRELADVPVVVDTQQDEGQELTENEKEAGSRDLLLSAGDAQPTVVIVSRSKDANAVMSIVDIKHQ